MGKPYQSELESIGRTFEWAKGTDIGPLASFVDASCGSPLVAIGSGGSLTAAVFAALLHEQMGGLAKAVTPLGFLSSARRAKVGGVLAVTAGGRNADILAAFRAAAASEAERLMAICMRTGTPLAELSRRLGRPAPVLELECPCGTDGFLATNSLVALCVVLTRAYGRSPWPGMAVPGELPVYQETCDRFGGALEPLLPKSTWVVLHGGWALPAAIDLESKCVEAALRHVQLADYRNFAHGRHHWLAKRGSESAVVALSTPEEERLAVKTLSLLPSEIPALHITADAAGATGGLCLLARVLHLVGILGANVGIDPGRPGVPSFGRRLYHLRIPPDVQQTEKLPGCSATETVAILRKSGHRSVLSMDEDGIRQWRESYGTFVAGVQKARFGAIVLDYDGTLCDRHERFEGLSKAVGSELARLLREGVVVGIATGRGRSVRRDIRGVVPQDLWGRVVVGYYNGAEIALLDDDRRPTRAGPVDASLEPVKDAFAAHPGFARVASYECRPKQISVMPLNPRCCEAALSITRDILAVLPTSVRVSESDHSIDITPIHVSKLAVVAACLDLAQAMGNPCAVLCIGDRGRWPGNDHALLTSPYSLSVDSVSADPGTCWNLAPTGYRGSKATTFYLSCLDARKGAARYRQLKGRVA